MSEVKDQIVKIITDGDLSSIQIISDRVGRTPEETIVAIQQLIAEGKLHGKVTDDGKRFFKEEVDISQRPVIEREKDDPDFLKFNPRPGLIVAVIGFVILLSGIIGYLSAADVDFEAQSFWAVVLFFGIAINMVGCYYLGTRRTP